MNEAVTVDSLGYNCSDAGEHITKIIAEINLGNKITYFDSENFGGFEESVTINSAFDLLGEESALKYLSNIKHDVYPVDFSKALDEQVLNLAESAVRYFKGKYNV